MIQNLPGGDFAPPGRKGNKNLPYQRKAPCLPRYEGKRSAVAVVNDSPVGCQSRDRGAPQSTGFAAGEDGGSFLS